MAPQMIMSNNYDDNDDDGSLYDLTSTTTAPTTPTTRHYNTNTSPLHFYSVPTSPLPTFDQTDPPTPKSFTYYDDDDFEDANNNFIEFEFGTSRRFTPDDYHDFYQMGLGFESPYHQNTKEQQEPVMAFADELFCDGKVMPLKPPPRLQNGNGNDSSFCLSSPRSPTTAALKFPFPRRSLWNDDFDPFMVALENVKDDEKRRKKSAKEHRRAVSMSPIRALSPKRPNKSISFHHPETNNQMEPNGPHSIWVPHKNKKIESLGGESKGVLFARHTRMVMTESEQSPSCTRKSKRQRIKKLLLRSVSSMGRATATATNEDKHKDCYQSEAPPQPQPQPQPQPTKKKSFARKFSFMSKGGGSDIAQCNEEKRVVSQVTNVTLMQYSRPRLFVCMGYGAAKYVN
ncbi:hypothetical protein EZV62_002041 [Acer yangbiense]|uniref:Uncharacterized protein n=1 Tax=Acer yangbiense TaxID=1000413 RepID=A0A5C7IXY5_9ROSI|nr:hypothetical protein EZV62_002041 [Acer yangbiense]